MALTLVLWDIDGTLIANGSAGRAVYPAAFALMTGEALTHMVEIDGRTELDIMDELLRVNGVAWPGSDRVCDVLAGAMRATVDRFGAGGRVLPGAVEALTALHDDGSVVQALLTGNIRPNAEMKLGVFGLDGYFDFDAGGYGSDDMVRANLVPVAQRRAGARYGESFVVSNTVLIGDTVRDIEAGRRGGARVIAVASGAESADNLRRARPDVLLADLGDAAALYQAIGAGHRT